MDLTGESAVQLAAWIQAIGASHSAAAFECLYRRYAPKLNAIMVARGIVPAVAEEAVHDVMAQVWDDAAHFDPQRDDASVWLWIIVRNHAYRAMFQHATIADMRRMFMLRATSLVPGSDALIASERRARAKQALLALPKLDREILMDAFEHGLPHSTIARQRGMPLGTIKGALRRTIIKLRASMLRPHG